MHHIDEATLRRLYLEEQMTVKQIAHLLHVRKQTICDRLKSFGIPTRPRARRLHIPLAMDATTLRRLYEEERWTEQGIADAYHVSRHTVRTALREAGIPRRANTWRRDRFAPAPDVLAAIKVRVAACGVPDTARLLHITPQKVYALTGEQPRWRGKRRRVDDEAVRAAYEEGLSVAELAGAWQCSARSIQRSLQRTYVRPESGTSPSPGTSSAPIDVKRQEKPFSDV